MHSLTSPTGGYIAATVLSSLHDVAWLVKVRSGKFWRGSLRFVLVGFGWVS